MCAKGLTNFNRLGILKTQRLWLDLNITKALQDKSISLGQIYIERHLKNSADTRTSCMNDPEDSMTFTEPQI